MIGPHHPLSYEYSYECWWFSWNKSTHQLDHS